MIFDSDFDTALPSADDPEEYDEWSMDTPSGQKSTNVPGRNISCFNASATLGLFCLPCRLSAFIELHPFTAGILGMIVQSIYAVRPVSSRHAESTVLEGLLDKWYFELPEHLRYEPSSSKQIPLPNVLTLHMQYWTTVLLLHRPL